MKGKREVVLEKNKTKQNNNNNDNKKCIDSTLSVVLVASDVSWLEMLSTPYFFLVIFYTTVHQIQGSRATKGRGFIVKMVKMNEMFYMNERGYEVKIIKVKIMKYLSKIMLHKIVIRVIRARGSSMTCSSSKGLKWWG